MSVFCMGLSTTTGLPRVVESYYTNNGREAVDERHCIALGVSNTRPEADSSQRLVRNIWRIGKR